jgi:hypothetical protein
MLSPLQGGLGLAPSSLLGNYPQIIGEIIFLRLLSQTLLLLERKILIVIDFPLTMIVIIEKRAENLIRMRKIDFSTLKSAFGF